MCVVWYCCVLCVDDVLCVDLCYSSLLCVVCCCCCFVLLFGMIVFCSMGVCIVFVCCCLYMCVVDGCVLLFCGRCCCVW